MTMLMVLMWIGRNSKIPAQNNWNNSLLGSGNSTVLLGSGNAPQLRHSQALQHQSASFHEIPFCLCGKEQECELYCFPHSWWKMSEKADENYTDLWNKEFMDRSAFGQLVKPSVMGWYLSRRHRTGPPVRLGLVTRCDTARVSQCLLVLVTPPW